MDDKQVGEQSTEELKVTVAEDEGTPSAETKPQETKPLSEDLSEAELAQYSEGVQKRIKQLSRQRHEERRAREAAERDKEETIRLAQAVWAENQQLKDKLTKGESALAGTVNTAAAAELDSAKRELKEAMEAYDADKIVEAQEKLNRAVLRAEQAKQFQARATRPQQQQPQGQPQPQYQPPPQQQQAAPDPKAREWQEANPWFGTDQEMTSLAIGLHNRLTAEHGPAYATTDEYYERINARVREKFPEYFGDQGTEPKTQQRPATVVAPATRSVPPKQITLTKRQADIARRLNVPLEQYAKQLAILENGNG